MGMSMLAVKLRSNKILLLGVLADTSGPVNGHKTLVVVVVVEYAQRNPVMALAVGG